jgi:hypothetical protein
MGRLDGIIKEPSLVGKLVDHRVRNHSKIPREWDGKLR